MHRIAAVLGGLRRNLSRGEWAARLLDDPPTPPEKHRRGLILLQIDGLARPQVEQALEHGRMPFLASLSRKEDYRLHSFYSGLPSTTPAVQGELFYGIPRAVPSFGFRDRATKAVTSMFNLHTAASVEERLEQQARGEGLLAGGSSYANVYTGGARRSAFCFTSIGFKRLLSGTRMLRIALVAALHAMTLVRVLLLLVVETVLAALDVLRGMVGTRDLGGELRFVPSRVLVCILLRELVTASVSMDAALGRSVIHANFLGYDEQSHRRGPSSAFAHWTLRGIDWSLQRIWRAAHRSRYRDYDIWIYSDHGQESTTPYRRRFGVTPRRAVEEALASIESFTEGAADGEGSVQARRAGLLGGRGKGLLGLLAPESCSSTGVCTGGLGPVMHVYIDRPELQDGERERIAERLVRDAHMPTVVWRDSKGATWALTEPAKVRLPDGAGEIFGPDHPFLEEAAEDLMHLTRHPNAGDLVIFGWRHGAPALTFPIEHGSHAGFGPNETHGFALLPHDAPLPVTKHPYIRPCDLREACLRFSGAPFVLRRYARTDRESLRVMTYNVHSCIGLDGRSDIDRYVRIIARHSPDIVALQEVDVGRERTEGIDQARVIADRLDMCYHFHPCVAVRDELYGIAVLSRMPLRLVRAGPLPNHPEEEPRGALWVETDWDGRPLQFVTTHLSLMGSQRLLQAQALVGDEWLGGAQRRGPLVFCGDLNTRPASRVYTCFENHLRDTALGDGLRPPMTWLGVTRLDYIWASPALRSLSSITVNTRLARRASDHVPVLADVVVDGEMVSSAELRRGGKREKKTYHEGHEGGTGGEVVQSE